jgi:uncharacterized protein (TIGR03435 family)
VRFALAALLPLCAIGQEFEVASVKLAPPFNPATMRMVYRGGPGTADPTRIVIENIPMMLLLVRAYDVNPFQISGDLRAPERYNITAKIPEGATPEQFRTMLQHLIADRFKMKLRRESREMPIYEMVVARGGPKLKEHEGEASVNDLNAAPGPWRDKNGRPIPPPNAWSMEVRQGSSTGHGMHNAVAETMQDFAKQLSRQLGRQVVNSTGLNGRYDFLLAWSEDASAASPGPPSAASTPDPDAAPALIPAIQQQLGLRLEPKRGPVEFLVIESFAKVPTEN